MRCRLSSNRRVTSGTTPAATGSGTVVKCPRPSSARASPFTVPAHNAPLWSSSTESTLSSGRLPGWPAWWRRWETTPPAASRCNRPAFVATQRPPMPSSARLATRCASGSALRGTGTKRSWPKSKRASPPALVPTQSLPAPSRVDRQHIVVEQAVGAGLVAAVVVARGSRPSATARSGRRPTARRLRPRPARPAAASQTARHPGRRDGTQDRPGGPHRSPLAMPAPAATSSAWQTFIAPARGEAIRPRWAADATTSR